MSAEARQGGRGRGRGPRWRSECLPPRPVRVRRELRLQLSRGHRGRAGKVNPEKISLGFGYKFIDLLHCVQAQLLICVQDEWDGRKHL